MGNKIGFLEKVNDTLADKVVKQIKKDIDAEDTTAIYELLEDVPEKKLKGYLPEK